MKKGNAVKSKDDSIAALDKTGIGMKRDFVIPTEILRPPLEKTASKNNIFPNLRDSVEKSSMPLKADDIEKKSLKDDLQVTFKIDKIDSKETSPPTQVNIDVSGKYPDENQDSSPVRDSYTRKRYRRPSVVRRKLIALENELTLENINKRVTRIFSPDIPKKQSEVTEDSNREKLQRNYLSSTMACIFIISVITGSSISSLPYYLNKSSKCFL